MKERITVKIEESESCKPIPGFPRYMVTKTGEVWSCKRESHFLSGDWKKIGGKSWRGYPTTMLTDENGKKHHKLVSRLVLEAFVGPAPKGMQACHFPDIDPGNCNFENLRWDTPQGNADDKTAHGNNPIGSKNPSAIITEDDVVEMFRLRSQGILVRDIAPRYKLSIAHTFRILSGGLWRHVECCREFDKRERKRRTPDEVREIRRKFASGAKLQDIAAEFNCGTQCIWLIVHGKIYKKVQ